MKQDTFQHHRIDIQGVVFFPMSCFVSTLLIYFKMKSHTFTVVCAIGAIKIIVSGGTSSSSFIE